MNRTDVITRLKSLEPEVRRRGVEALYLYGSFARDEATDQSDIDILVDFAEEPDLSTYLAPYSLIESAFPGRTIGYGTRENIALPYRDNIEATAIRVI